MKRIFLPAVCSFFLFPVLLRAQCISVPDSLSVSIPAAGYGNSIISFALENHDNPEDPDNLYFRLSEPAEASSSRDTLATVEPTLDIYIPCIEYQGTQYAVYLEPCTNPENSSRYYWQLADAQAADPLINRKPYAASLSIKADSTTPYIQQQLIGNDPDHDTIIYELISPSSGPGYSSAYINPDTGILYLTHEPAGNDDFSVYYRVTDGQHYSHPAEVNITVDYISENNKKTGKNDVDPETYAGFDLSSYNSDLLGTAGESPESPASIDLSPNFPRPGDQGEQNSCVGWATAYALKSYQEKLETGWSLNIPGHLFSPSYIYNQIMVSQDQGSYIFDALDLAVEQGIATLATMPYNNEDYLSQPSAQARMEAAEYKAADWFRINDTSQIKAALVNRKPVVAGIEVYPELMDLYGPDSVYRTTEGNSLGAHAVTITGYNDNQYGGAFKAINSWGVDWGDNGYFWIPYNYAARGIMNEAYVLENTENTDDPAQEPEDPGKPGTADGTLPNLTVQAWNVSYNPRPGGEGSLTYSIVNSGSAPAPRGADINLMLSRNQEITSGDYYVIYESISFDLEPGESVYRDENNPISFRFPDQIEPGTYYMALWVDDLNVVAESRENDNISLGEETISVQNSLPDLSVNTWYATWNASGSGTLTYEVINAGATAVTGTDWYVNLILDPDQNIGNGNEHLLFYEKAGDYLQPGYSLYRNQYYPAYFNLYQDYSGSPIPSGTYFLALWVDDLNNVAESNEMNNGSYSWGTVPITGYGSQEDINRRASLYSALENSGKAYNGKRLPPRNPVKRKVEISRTDSGKIAMKFLDEEKGKPRKAEFSVPPGKEISSGTSLVHPKGKGIPMPGGNGSQAR